MNYIYQNTLKKQKTTIGDFPGRKGAVIKIPYFQFIGLKLPIVGELRSQVPRGPKIKKRQRGKTTINW